MKPSNHHLRRKSTPAISLTGLKWPAHEDNGGGGGDDEDDEDEQGGKRKGASSSSRRRTDLLMAQASPRHEGCGFDSAQPPSIRTIPLEIPQILIRKWMDDTNCHSSPSASSETPSFSNAADQSDQLVAFEKAFLLNGAERCAWPAAAATFSNAIESPTSSTGSKVLQILSRFLLLEVKLVYKGKHSPEMNGWRRQSGSTSYSLTRF